MIDLTTEDYWLRDNFSSRPYVQRGETFETHDLGSVCVYSASVTRVIQLPQKLMLTI